VHAHQNHQLSIASPRRTRAFLFITCVGQFYFRLHQRPTSACYPAGDPRPHASSVLGNGKRKRESILALHLSAVCESRRCSECPPDPPAALALHWECYSAPLRNQRRSCICTCVSAVDVAGCVCVCVCVCFVSLARGPSWKTELQPPPCALRS